MAIELVPLCTLRLQLKPPIEVGAGPAGTRLIVEVVSAQVKGDRLRGEMLGAAAADWVIVGPGGTGTVDVRATLQTDDGAIIFVQYNGRLDTSQGLQFPMTACVAPLFETGDERYAWLNRIQAVGKGILYEDLSLDYEWYEVR
jgi:Protein of unknown function (DUF3237)